MKALNTKQGGLCLTRYPGEGVCIVVGNQVIEIMVVEARGRKVRLKIDAEKEFVTIRRTECLTETEVQNLLAGMQP